VALTRPRLFFTVAFAWLLVGAVVFGQGIYIYLKADLAQWLLNNAWQKARLTHQPVKPWPWADTWPVARMWVPAQQIELIILAGDTGRTLAFGPGYRLGTAIPGEVGNSIISAHRDTHFRFIKSLRSGDEIFIENNLGEQKRYIVSGTDIVDSRFTRLKVDIDQAALTLVTCFPFDAIVAGGPLRYIVFAVETEPSVSAITI